MVPLIAFPLILLQVSVQSLHRSEGKPYQRDSTTGFVKIIVYLYDDLVLPRCRPKAFLMSGMHLHLLEGRCYLLSIEPSVLQVEVTYDHYSCFDGDW